jgi:trans-aconitate methyltransferase
MVGKLIDQGPKPVQNIIELGCAPGLMLQALYRLRPKHQYFGIDYSIEGLAIAQHVLNANAIKPNLIHADIQTYVPEKKFDMVISFGLVEHFADPVEIISAHRKFADKNGCVVVVIPNLSNRYVKKALEKFRPIDLQTHNLNIMSENALTNALIDSGLRDIQVGGVLGPWLPTPKETPTLLAKTYHVFSHIWDGCIRFVPPRWTWYGYYWAIGKV